MRMKQTGLAAAILATTMLSIPLSNGDVMEIPDANTPRNHKGRPMTKFDLEAIWKARLKKERKLKQRLDNYEQKRKIKSGQKEGD
jgi:hypothetical protein